MTRKPPTKIPRLQGFGGIAAGVERMEASDLAPSLGFRTEGIVIGYRYLHYVHTNYILYIYYHILLYIIYICYIYMYIYTIIHSDMWGEQVCVYGKRPKRSMEKPALNRSRRWKCVANHEKDEKDIRICRICRNRRRGAMQSRAVLSEIPSALWKEKQRTQDCWPWSHPIVDVEINGNPCSNQ